MEDPIMQFFAFDHLPENLTAILLPDNAERAAALRKLLEAKDCAVRAVLSK